MPNNHVAQLLNELEQQATAKSKQVEYTFAVSQEDLIKIQALAELYQMSPDKLAAELLHTVLLEVEEKMPYKPGTKVIRMEEGDPVYEDVGPMPRYIAIKHRLSNNTKCA
ncbi:MAG: hypothetical protein OIF55_11300 [Amphritea sp.]|nr:hypothetical protein [Amphritea sp.]